MDRLCIVIEQKYKKLQTTVFLGCFFHTIGCMYQRLTALQSPNRIWMANSALACLLACPSSLVDRKDSQGEVGHHLQPWLMSAHKFCLVGTCIITFIILTIVMLIRIVCITKHGYFHFRLRTVDANTNFVPCRSHLVCAKLWLLLHYSRSSPVICANRFTHNHWIRMFWCHQVITTASWECIKSEDTAMLFYIEQCCSKLNHTMYPIRE